MISSQLCQNLAVLSEILGASPCLLLQSSVVLVSQIDSKTESLIQFTSYIREQYQSSLAEGNPLVLSINDSLTPISLQDELNKQNIDSLLLLPLDAENFNQRVLVLFYTKKIYSWTDKDLEIIRKIVLQCLALDEHFKHQIKRDFLLQSINSRLNSNLSLNELFREIFNLIGISFKFDHILLIQANRNQITLTQEWKRDPEIDSYFHDEEFLHCCLGKELLHISRQFCHQYQNQQRINLVTIPITVKSEFFGLLVLKTRDCERQLSSPEIENLESIAEQIAIAINFEQKQEFLDETVHELRNPLVGILGFARVLEEQIYGTLNDKQLQYINLIANSGVYLKDLINDFLDLSRVDADKEELFLEKFAVEDLCLASLALVQQRAEEVGLDCRLEIAKNVNFCRADQRRLKQILVNLLSNAIKFTETGSVTLKVECEKQQLIFSIIDTGIGIELEDQKKLFRPFGQIKKHLLTRKHKGSGLGLALSRKLAQLHGGDITLTSEVGKGTCLMVVIPNPLR